MWEVLVTVAYLDCLGSYLSGGRGDRASFSSLSKSSFLDSGLFWKGVLLWDGQIMPDILIQGSDIVIDLVPDRGVDPAVDNAYRLLHQRLVLGFSAPCRKNRAAIMVCKVQKTRVDHRFIPVGFGDGTF